MKRKLAPLIGSMLLFLACGAVTPAGDDGAGDAGRGGSGGMSTDAGRDQTPTDSATSGTGGGSGGTAGQGGTSGGGGRGGGAGSCAPWPNGLPPYCSSCQCANGSQGEGCCVCGTLPCCDPSCQS